jgi:hypothetical protein
MQSKAMNEVDAGRDRAPAVECGEEPKPSWGGT